MASLKINRRHFLASAALGLAALAGCNSGATTTSTSTSSGVQSAAPAGSANAAGAKEKMSGQPFTVAYNQWIGFSGVFLAKDKGFFKEAGLDVQLKPFNGPADGVPPLIAGQLDAAMTTADTPILLSKESGENALRNVMAIDVSNGADGIVAQKGIKSVRDLKGKTVAATKGQINEFLLLKALQSVGMSEKDVTITNMDAETSGAAVLAGKVPAAVTWEPWLSKAGASGGSVIFSSAQTPNLMLDVVAVSDKTLKSKPADVRAFVAACLQGNELALKQPAEAAKIAKKYFGTTEAEALAMLKKVKLYSASDNRTLIGTAQAPGQFAKSSAEIAAFFVSQKVMAEAPKEPNLFTAEYLPR